MPFAIGVVMLVPVIAITMHPIIERNTIRRLGTDSQFDQNPPPALTFITFVMVTDIAHASSRGSGDLQCKAHMPPISAATPVIIIERFCRNIVFHTEAPTKSDKSTEAYRLEFPIKTESLFCADKEQVNTAKIAANRFFS